VKKFPLLKDQIAGLADQLAETPELVKGIGQACYKSRLAIAAKGGGKSGGGRIITNVRVTRKRVYLLYIFDPKRRGYAHGQGTKGIACIDPA